MRPGLRAPLSIPSVPARRSDTRDPGLERGPFLDTLKGTDDLSMCDNTRVHRANGLLNMDCENLGMKGDLNCNHT